MFNNFIEHPKLIFYRQTVFIPNITKSLVVIQSSKIFIAKKENQIKIKLLVKNIDQYVLLPPHNILRNSQLLQLERIAENG